MKIHFFSGGGGSGRWGMGMVGGGGSGRCERRSEVFVKIQNKNWGVVRSGRMRGCRVGGGGGVRVDVNEELKFS